MTDLEQIAERSERFQAQGGLALASCLAQEDVPRLIAEVRRLRGVVGWYAGLGMAELHSGDREPGEFVNDLGARARAALHPQT